MNLIHEIGSFDDEGAQYTKYYIIIMQRQCFDEFEESTSTQTHAHTQNVLCKEENNNNCTRILVWFGVISTCLFMSSIG